VSLFAADADAPFDPKEKISLNLKDASIPDLVMTLGALANLPVSIDPGVSGTFTGKLVDMPYEDVLKAITAKTGVLVRIEEGKLVASRSKAAEPSGATLPPNYRDAPRLRVSEVSKTFPEKPIYARTDWSGYRACHLADFSQRPTANFLLGPKEKAPRLSLTQFAFDPVTGLRSIALDGAGFTGSVAVGGKNAVTLGRQTKEAGVVNLSLGEVPAGDGCSEDSVPGETSRRSLQLAFTVRESPADGGPIVAAPSIGVLAGQSFKMRTGLRDEKTGLLRREIVVSGYVSADGSWVAASLMATATWVDPADGLEYFFTQSSAETAAVPVTSDDVLAATLREGVAAPRPLELRMSRFDPTAPPPKK